MKYKDIAEKYDVSINTVKSWKRRYWQSENEQKTTETTKKVATKRKKVAKKVASENASRKTNRISKGDTFKKRIHQDLLQQLKDNGINGAHFIDLVEDYMSLWEIKNDLIADIKDRGVVVTWSNGKQQGKKKNESINELNKTNAQMLKLLAELNLKAIVKKDDDDDDYPDV
ncbi:P27 family phage terminase small subunit [Bacillus cereus]|nr:P27 family phage terminase small subunit [Bacillus cereus]MEB9569670.1 P27 family phage terminase small subunit [Bacillus cereus]